MPTINGGEQEMNKYYVELDGVDTIVTYETLVKDDILELDELGEKSYYRVRKVDGKNLALRLVKTVKAVEHETKFAYKKNSDESCYFSNRLSLNQTVLVGAEMFVVSRSEDGGLLLEGVKTKSAQVSYTVYGARKGSKREVLMYTTSYQDAISYIAEKRGMGEVASL